MIDLQSATFFFLQLNMNTCFWCCCSVPQQVFIFRSTICSTPVLFATAQTFIDLSSYLKHQKTKLTQRGIKASAEGTPASASLYLHQSSCSLWCFESTGRVFTIMQRKRKVEETKTQVQHIKVQQVNGALGNNNYCICNSGTGEHLEIKQGAEILRRWKHNVQDSEQKLVRPRDYKIFLSQC